MKNIFILFLFASISLVGFSQNKIDKIKGFHSYKFEMSKVDCKIKKGDPYDFGEYFKYPKNLSVGKISIPKIGLVFDKEDFLEKIYVYIGKGYDKLIPCQVELEKMYGKPIINYKMDYNTGNKTKTVESYMWSGELVNVYLFPDQDLLQRNGHCILYKWKGKKQETSF